MDTNDQHPDSRAHIGTYGPETITVLPATNTAQGADAELTATVQDLISEHGLATILEACGGTVTTDIMWSAVRHDTDGDAYAFNLRASDRHGAERTIREFCDDHPLYHVERREIRDTVCSARETLSRTCCAQADSNQ